MRLVADSRLVGHQPCTLILPCLASAPLHPPLAATLVTRWHLCGHVNTLPCATACPVSTHVPASLTSRAQNLGLNSDQACAARPPST
jgi:hypothetical protein